MVDVVEAVCFDDGFAFDTRIELELTLTGLYGAFGNCNQRRTKRFANTYMLAIADFITRLALVPEVLEETSVRQSVYIARYDRVDRPEHLSLQRLHGDRRSRKLLARCLHRTVSCVL